MRKISLALYTHSCIRALTFREFLLTAPLIRLTTFLLVLSIGTPALFVISPTKAKATGSVPVTIMAGGQIKLYRSFFGKDFGWHGPSASLIKGEDQRRLFVYLHEVAHLTNRYGHTAENGNEASTGFEGGNLSQSDLNSWVWYNCFSNQ